MKPEIKTFYYKNGNIESQQYFLNGKLHNENGPAYIYYYENGNILSQQYYLNDKRFRSLEELQYYAKHDILT